MTVSQLMRWLQDHPADAEVVVRSRGFFGCALPVEAACLVTLTRRKGSDGLWLHEMDPLSNYDNRTAVMLTPVFDHIGDPEQP